MQIIGVATLGVLLGAVTGSAAVVENGAVPFPNPMGNSAIEVTDSSEKAQPPAPAKVLIDEAVKKAKAENKTVLVHYGASWCGYCKRFNAFLNSEEVGKIVESHYVVLRLVAQEREDKKSLENPGVDSIAQVLQLKRGLPVYFFLDGEGNKIADSGVMPPNGGNIGYPVTPEEVSAFGELLKKTAPRMTEEERTKLTEYLTNAAKKS
jgi:thiol-disulfide isomerase/thioredoxin